jgi:glycosyltransferase involved in cell wall biosynthesis
VLNQTYSHVEIIIVDDGSQDHTLEVTSYYPQIHYIRQKNQGLAAARNVGIRASKGSYLVFLDADDRLLPIAIEAGVTCFSANLDCAFVSGAHIRIAANGSPFGKPEMCQVYGDKNHYIALLRGNYIKMHATVMYRRNVLISVGGFNTSLAACEDYDLYFRIARIYPIYLHNQVIAEYRMHNASMSNNASLMLKTVLSVINTQWQYIKSDKQQRKAYQDGIRFYKSYYGKKLLRHAAHMSICGEAKQALQGVKIFLRHAGLMTILRCSPCWLAEATFQWFRQWRVRL